MIPADLLPAEWMPKAFIAGGYAACPALATDVDVWISVRRDCHAEYLAIVRNDILAHLTATGYDHIPQDADDSARAQFVRPTNPDGLAHDQFITSAFEEYYLTVRIRRVCAVNVHGLQAYHLILVAGEVDDVLASFDISTHQCALTPRGFVAGAYWTPLTEPPVVIAEKYTAPERLVKIRERYAPFRKDGI